MGWLAVRWHSDGPELLYSVTLLREEVLQGLLWPAAQQNAWGWLCVQTWPVLRKPLSSAASQLCLGIPDFQIICMGSAFSLGFEEK